MSDLEVRSLFELKLLDKAKQIVPTNDIPGWTKSCIIQANGVFCAGWTAMNHIVLISSQGYSITNTNGERLVRDHDMELTLAAMNDDTYSFEIPSSGEVVQLFGEDGGFTKLSGCGWRVELIYPFWPRCHIAMKEMFNPNHRLDEYLDNTYLLDIKKLDGWLNCSFSSDGRSLAIIGSGGAEIYIRN